MDRIRYLPKEDALASPLGEHAKKREQVTNRKRRIEKESPEAAMKRGPKVVVGEKEKEGEVGEDAILTKCLIRSDVGRNVKVNTEKSSEILKESRHTEERSKNNEQNNKIEEKSERISTDSQKENKEKHVADRVAAIADKDSEKNEIIT